jgi:hypothetical protein
MKSVVEILLKTLAVTALIFLGLGIAAAMEAPFFVQILVCAPAFYLFAYWNAGKLPGNTQFLKCLALALALGLIVPGIVGLTGYMENLPAWIPTLVWMAILYIAMRSESRLQGWFRGRTKAEEE